MSLVFCDSVDHYTTSQMTRKWTSVAGAVTTSPGNGRNSTTGLRSTNWDASFYKTLAPRSSTFVIGFALKVAALPAAARALVAVVDGSTTHCYIALLASGAIQAFRGDGTSLGTSSAGVVTSGSYLYIEVKFVINNTTGSVEVHINETTVLNLTGQDTQNSANVDADVVRFLGGGTLETATIDFDDIYVDNSTFLGNTQVEARLVNAVGAHAEWSPNGAAANWQCVDENPSDDDTTHVSSATVGHRDVHNTEGPSLSTGTVHGVQTLVLARKDGDLSRSIQRIVRPGSTNYAGPTDYALLSTYKYFHEMSNTNPDTAAAWTLSQLQTAQFGYIVSDAPPVIPDYLWFKGDRINEAGNGGLSDGNTISFWYDSTNNGRNADNSVGGDNPIFRTGANGINNLPVVEFASDKLLFRWSETGPLNVSLTEYTFYIVLSVTGEFLFQGAIIQTDQGAGVKGFAFGLRENFDDFTWWLANRTAGIVDTIKSSPVEATDPPYAALMLSGNSDILMWKNGVSLSLSAGGPSLSSARGLDPDTHALIKIAEVLIFRSKHDAATRIAVEAYLRSKWATP